jgi:hypothetical protein
VCTLNSPVHETRNDVMTVLICNSAELRRGMFYSVSVTCIEHIIENYNSIVCACLMDAAFWEFFLRRLWSVIITVVLRLVVLRFVRQAFVSAMCPWFGLRFCHCLTLHAYCSWVRGFPSCLSLVILSAFGDEALYRSALWVTDEMRSYSHSFYSMFSDRSVASFKTSSPQSAI